MIRIPVKFELVPPGSGLALGGGLVGAVVTDATGKVFVAVDVQAPSGGGGE